MHPPLRWYAGNPAPDAGPFPPARSRLWPLPRKRLFGSRQGPAEGHCQAANLFYADAKITKKIYHISGFCQYFFAKTRFVFEILQKSFQILLFPSESFNFISLPLYCIGKSPSGREKGLPWSPGPFLSPRRRLFKVKSLEDTNPFQAFCRCALWKTFPPHLILGILPMDPTNFQKPLW